MKFLCDEMLQRLGNWLRAAGYDTLVESDGRSDYDLLRQAIDEGRYLITRDQKLMEHRRAPGNVILLTCDGLEECVRSLSEQLPVDWQYQPFKRCTVCNTPLNLASAKQMQSIPANSQKAITEAFYCPTCDQVYWDGSHVKRMRAQLEKWHALYNS
ncbi:MAG: DUF5615 family PIN-like protein [Gammaproteobacteria bacterium]|jgi:uncharacterized protein with PIN domain